ncbi:MAG: aerotolerance regulator BatA, partial [Proteobacteria bacterium]|nr:aerotolerance regulator BatA [Pseudomonadota bacterium]
MPVIAWIRHRAEGRRTGAIRFSSVSAAREAAGITSGWAHRVPGILRAVALTALIVALARPQTGMTSEDVRTQGIDILLALDVSSSMLAEDLEPNRLSAAKSVAAEF